MVGQSGNKPELEEKYYTAYAVLLNNRVVEQLLKMDKPSPLSNDQDFCEAVMISLVRQSNHYSHRHKSYKQKGVSMEEVMDEDKEEMSSTPRLKGNTHLLEDMTSGVISTSKDIHPSLQPHITKIEDDDKV